MYASASEANHQNRRMAPGCPRARRDPGKPRSLILDTNGPLDGALMKKDLQTWLFLGFQDESTGFVTLMTAPSLPVIPGAVARREGGRLHRGVARTDRRGGRAGLRLPHGRRADRRPRGADAVHGDAVAARPALAEGINAYFKATNLPSLDDSLIDTFCELHVAAPGPQCEIHVHQMRGAVARVAEGATAFAERSMPVVLNAVTGWTRPRPRRSTSPGRGR